MTMQDPFVLHGIGTTKLFDFTTGVEVLEIKRAETGSLDLKVTDKQVFGGDALDAFEVFETSRDTTLTLTDCEFDFQQFAVATGKSVVATLSAPMYVLREGAQIPASPGPYTVTLENSTTAKSTSVRVQFANRDDFAPVPYDYTAANAVLTSVGTGVFPKSAVIKTRITAVTLGGLESVASAQVTSTEPGTDKCNVVVTTPLFALETPSGELPIDANIVGYNIYVNDGVNPEYCSNASPIAKGASHTLVVTPGAGAGAPDTTPTVTGQYTVTAGVATFASADAGELITLNYYYTTSASTAEAQVVDVLTTCLRKFVGMMWSTDFVDQNNNVRRLEIEIFKCKYMGDYKLDFNRNDAVKHQMMFQVLDANRPDKKLMSFKVAPLPAASNC